MKRTEEPASPSPGVAPATGTEAEGGGVHSPMVRRLLPMVFLATFFIRFGFGITVSIFAFYLGAGQSNSVETVGLAAAAAPLIEMSSVLWSGLLADHVGRFPVLRAGLALGAVLLVLMATNRDVWVQALLSGLFGLSSGAILASSLAIIGDATPAKERGSEMGRFDAVNLFGWIMGFAVGYMLVSLFDGSGHTPARLAPSFLFGAVAVASALLLVLLRARHIVEKRGAHFFDLARFRSAVLDPDILLVVLPWATIYMLLGALFTFLGTAATSQQIGLHPWELGAAVAVGGSLLLFTQPFYGRLADRRGRAPIMGVGIVGFLGILLFGSIIAWDNGLSPAYIGYPAVAGLGLSALAALAFGPSSLAALADLSKRISRGTTMALYSLMIAAGMFVGISLSSGLFTWLGNRGVVLFFGLIAAFLVTLTLLRSSRERRASRGSASPAASPP